MKFSGALLALCIAQTTAFSVQGPNMRPSLVLNVVPKRVAPPAQAEPTTNEPVSVSAPIAAPKMLQNALSPPKVAAPTMLQNAMAAPKILDNAKAAPEQTSKNAVSSTQYQSMENAFSAATAKAKVETKEDVPVPVVHQAVAPPVADVPVTKAAVPVPKAAVPKAAEQTSSNAVSSTQLQSMENAVSDRKEVQRTKDTKPKIRKEQTARDTKTNLEDVNMDVPTFETPVPSFETDIREQEQFNGDQGYKQTARDTRSNLKDNGDQGYTQTARDTRSNLKDNFSSASNAAPRQFMEDNFSSGYGASNAAPQQFMENNFSNGNVAPQFRNGNGNTRQFVEENFTNGNDNTAPLFRNDNLSIGNRDRAPAVLANNFNNAVGSMQTVSMQKAMENDRPKNVWVTSDPVTVQGGSLRTCSFSSPTVKRVKVSLSTNGRPMNANVDLWSGPDNVPQKMSVYIEDGSERPFSAVIATPRGHNAVAIRNTGQMEFPLEACVEADARDTPDNAENAILNLLDILPEGVQGGASKTYSFEPSVASVQILLETDGRPLNARIELLQGPNNNKQVIELYTEDGRERPFYAVLETPGVGNVVRIVNTAPVEFPMTARVEPYMIDEASAMSGAWDPEPAFGPTTFGTFGSFGNSNRR